jgi:CxxC motif-containing protein (DUF1111 family)
MEQAPVIKQVRWIVRIVAAASLVSTVGLWWYDRKVSSDAQAVVRGEEVYASHDCTDCHLPAHILRQKKAQHEISLIRKRRTLAEVTQFLESDARHDSYLLMTQNDRDDLIFYLKSLLPR